MAHGLCVIWHIYSVGYSNSNFTYFVTVVHCLYSTLQQGMRNLHFHLWKAINNRMLACIIHTI